MLQVEIDHHIQAICALKDIEPEIRQAADMLIMSIREGGKILICGNGGSATDAQHFSGEIVGRFLMERPGWPALALGADVASLTAIANDYGFSDVFSRQVDALGRPGDVLVGISTSGNSENIIKAARAAKANQMHAIGMTGGNGGKLPAHFDPVLIVPSNETPRIQEAHMFILHHLAGCIEKALARQE